MGSDFNILKSDIQKETHTRTTTTTKNPPPNKPQKTQSKIPFQENFTTEDKVQEERGYFQRVTVTWGE